VPIELVDRRTKPAVSVFLPFAAALRTDPVKERFQFRRRQRQRLHVDRLSMTAINHDADPRDRNQAMDTRHQFLHPRADVVEDKIHRASPVDDQRDVQALAPYLADKIGKPSWTEAIPETRSHSATASIESYSSSAAFANVWVRQRERICGIHGG
jgi:hypothetical protein